MHLSMSSRLSLKSEIFQKALSTLTVHGFDAFKTVLEIRNLSKSTFDTYCTWVRRFLEFLSSSGIEDKSTFDTYCTWVRRFLEFLSSSGIEDTSDIELSHAREITM